jgi:hypothetical protein
VRIRLTAAARSPACPDRGTGGFAGDEARRRLALAARQADVTQDFTAAVDTAACTAIGYHPVLSGTAQHFQVHRPRPAPAERHPARASTRPGKPVQH